MADRQFVVEVLDAQTAQIRSGNQIVGTLSVAGSRVTGTTPGAAASLVTWLGNGQSSVVGQTVTVPPAVRVLDASGLPVAGSTVTFQLGTGTSAAASSMTHTTDSNGVATIGSWSVGTTAGQANTLFARSGALTNSPLGFTTTPVAGSAFSVTASGGTSQTTTATGTYPSRLSALVHDQYGNPVNGASVTMSSTDADGVFGATALTTNSSGVAGTTYVSGQIASVQSILAAISSTTSARYSLTITAADPVLSIVQGDAQVSTSDTSLPTRPTVLVVDGFNNPWSSGQTIQFVVVTGSGTVSSATSTPGSGGTADVDWKLGAGTGSNQLEVSLLGVSNSTITFNASATNPQADTIAKFGGEGQSATVAAATAATLEWIATGGGSASAGQVVTFDIVPSGSLSVAQTTSSSTGIIRVTPTAGTTASIYTVTATATGLTGSPSRITFVGTADSASSLTFSVRPSSSAEAGTVFASQPVIITTDVYGNLVESNDQVTATLLSGTGPLTATNLVVTASGATATYSGMKVGASGVHVIAFDATSRSRCTSQVDATPPFATQLAFTTQPTGGAVGGGIGTTVVAVQDNVGTVVTGATDAVTLTLSAGGTLSGTLTVNAVGGYATFSDLAVSAAGTYTLSASATGLTGATSASFTVTAATSNIPTDVTMVEFVDADLTTLALDTAFTQGNTYAGMTQGTGASNMRVRLLSNQAWRTGGATIPSCPNGLDRVLVCAFSPNGSNVIAAGEKGLLYKASPANTKTIYLRWYGLISSNWYGQTAGSFKKFYFRNSAAQPAVFLYDGAGTANVFGKINWQPPNAGVKVTCASHPRNTWVLWEVVAVAPTTAGGTDGHMTVYKDGTKAYQRTDMATGATTWGEWQFLNYYGGTGNTTVTAGNGQQYSVVGDGFYFATSTSRAAVPA